MIIRIITNYVANFLILRLTFLIKNKKNHLNMILRTRNIELLNGAIYF